MLIHDAIMYLTEPEAVRAAFSLVLRRKGLTAAAVATQAERTSIAWADYASAELARIDGLTGLPNRRAWDEELVKALHRARRTRQPHTLYCGILLIGSWAATVS